MFFFSARILEKLMKILYVTKQIRNGDLDATTAEFNATENDRFRQEYHSKAGNYDWRKTVLLPADGNHVQRRI